MRAAATPPRVETRETRRVCVHARPPLPPAYSVLRSKIVFPFLFFASAGGPSVAPSGVEKKKTHKVHASYRAVDYVGVRVKEENQAITKILLAPWIGPDGWIVGWSGDTTRKKATFNDTLQLQIPPPPLWECTAGSTASRKHDAAFRQNEGEAVRLAIRDSAVEYVAGQCGLLSESAVWSLGDLELLPDGDRGSDSDSDSDSTESEGGREAERMTRIISPLFARFSPGLLLLCTPYSVLRFLPVLALSFSFQVSDDSTRFLAAACRLRRGYFAAVCSLQGDDWYAPRPVCGGPGGCCFGDKDDSPLCLQRASELAVPGISSAELLSSVQIVGGGGGDDGGGGSNIRTIFPLLFPFC